MSFPKLTSWSSLTVVGMVVLFFGLGLTILSVQKPQDNRTRASTVPNVNECNTQVSGRRCCSVTYPGAMCMDDNTGQACAGGFIYTTNSYTTWYCPGGDHYRCCFDAEPQGNAGGDKTVTLPTNSTTLTGTCSDADQDSRNLKSCNWSQVSGPNNATISNPTSTSTTNTTTVSGLQQGSYVFRLTAGDGYQSKTDDTTVTVNPAANQPPTANAGTDQSITLPANSVTLHGSGTDPEGGTLTYSWQKKTGPSTFTITNDHAATTTVTGLVEGVYTFTLTVTDNGGLTKTDDVVITVSRSLVTKFKLVVVIHDIGIGCDNSSKPTDTWCGTTDPAHPTRGVTVELRETSAGEVIKSQTGQLDFSKTNGNYTSHEDLDMGTALTDKSYVVRVIAGPARITTTLGINAGETNTITVTLINADANLDGQLSPEDYDTIKDCLNVGGPITNCDPVKAANANLDDSQDGVNLPDLNVFLREIKVQPL